MPHILITGNTAWSIANFRAELITHLRDAGHEVTVLAPPDEHVTRLEAMGCRVLPLTMDNKGTSPARDFALFLRFLRVFRSERPDAVLSYTIKNNIYGGLAARVMGLPFLPVATGLGTAFIRETWMTKLVSFLYARAFARCDAVFFLNEDDRRLFVERGILRADQAQRLPGEGIDLDHFAEAPPPNNPEPVFLLVARMLRDKGVVEFVEAARLLRQRGVKGRWQLLGDVDVENQTALTRSEVEGWVSEGAVEYLGTTSDVRPRLAAADCVVLPSYREGVSRVLMEAAAMARPIVASDVPGCRDLLDDGVNGLFCAPRDATDLARAMEQMAALTPEARAAMGQAGRAKMAETFATPHVLGFYDAWLSNFGTAKAETEVPAPAR